MREERRMPPIPDWMDHPDDPGPMPEVLDFTPNVMATRERITTDTIPILIEPKMFRYRHPEQIAPRKWLYGNHLCRQYASATIAPGGAGKTTLTVTDALAMASGKNLIGTEVHSPMRVWIWNGEDPRDELERRVVAAMMFHQISADDISDRLFIDSGRELPIKIGRTTSNGPMVAQPVVDALTSAIRSKQIDVLIVDPFVSVHSMSENDNSAMDAVVKAFALIADRTECAIDLVHHSRKLNGMDADIDAARGGSAIACAVRAARVLNVMSADAAEGFAIQAGDRSSFVRIDSAKGNLAPPASAQWLRLSSQPLGNSTVDRSEDCVAVAEAWTPPNDFDAVCVKDLLRVQEAVNGKALRANDQANEWVGHVIGPILGLNSFDKMGKRRIKRILKTWIATEALRIERVQDSKGHYRPVVVVGEWTIVD